MGVAIADADHDGLMDLFVTNFVGQQNNFYHQHRRGLFVDISRAARLYDASYELVGFGTQFLDADLDTHPDLVLTNGHVEDRRSKGELMNMRPQFFRNMGKLQFQELRGETAGSFFDQEVMGRGLARLDWNRDGLPDFAVSHLDTPTRLVTNRTSTNHHFLKIRLRGMNGARDAIGTTINMTCGPKQLYFQLTAGDGFQASNERQLLCGLGDAERVDRLQVRWPSGTEDVFNDVSADAEIILVEGLGRVIEIVR